MTDATDLVRRQSCTLKMFESIIIYLWGIKSEKSPIIFDDADCVIIPNITRVISEAILHKPLRKRMHPDLAKLKDLELKLSKIEKQKTRSGYRK